VNSPFVLNSPGGKRGVNRPVGVNPPVGVNLPGGERCVSSPVSVSDGTLKIFIRAEKACSVAKISRFLRGGP
jgi:hypothetical protein